MSTIFYALNGIYGNESAKLSAEGMEEYQRPRKMVKLEWKLLMIKYFIFLLPSFH